jgi:ERCC4-related helicase
MDEAHHLKNPKTSLARQLQTTNVVQDLRTGDGAMARAFDRMLFLTATPFQLGHRELVRVLERFGDVRWDENALGAVDAFSGLMQELSKKLDDSQRAAIRLQQTWSRLSPGDCEGSVEDWWKKTLEAPHEALNARLRAVVDAYAAAKSGRDAAQQALQTWIVRHNKGTLWAGTDIRRRCRMAGASIAGQDASNGLPIPPGQMLPFFLAARSAARPEDDLLGEALSSSYEAFRSTRQSRKEAKDGLDDGLQKAVDLSHAGWYLEEFDRALKSCSSAAHPKVDATVRKVVDLWEAGEKVLVFAFYRYTVRSLRIHISREIDRRIMTAGRQRLQSAGRAATDGELEELLDRIQRRFFDDVDSPGRRAVDAALGEIMQAHQKIIEKTRMTPAQREDLTHIMRRFLRVPTTLVRYFPLAELDAITPDHAVQRTLECADGSGLSWLQKLGGFIEFLTERCSPEERELYLEAAGRTQTGGIRVEGDAEDDPELPAGTVTLANVQVAMGATRREARARLMRAFNTPFFPDILVCSQVMGEGVDLQRFCRHVIHHDLAWNPSTIEQRTGRVDRLGCKAEGRQPIVVYLPYLAGTADERQYRVMSDREQWFRVVMGQDEVAKLITSDSIRPVPLPDAISDALCFKLSCDASL